MPATDTGKHKLDFNRANNLQRKSLREVLTRIFRKEKALAMFLDEELNMDLDAEVENGTLKEQVYELIQVFVARGKLNLFMEKLAAHEDYRDSPDLQNLLIAWDSIASGAPAQAMAAGNGGAAAPAAVIPPATPGSGSAAGTGGSAPGPETMLRAIDAKVEPGATAAEPIQRILDGGDKRIRPLAWLSDLASLRRRVCLIRIGNSGRATALLVGKDRLLTAAYVVNGANPAEMRGMDAVFDFGIDRDAKARQRVVKIVTPFLVVDPPSPFKDGSQYLSTLDYALLKLAEPIGGELLEDGSPRGWFALQDTRERLREGEEVLMIHHAAGREMALSEGLIEAPPAESNRLQHTCPSEPGSGGAPIMDATFRLVGLHELWRTDPGADGKQGPRVKIAVRADAIARDLEARGIAMEAPPKASRAGKH